MEDGIRYKVNSEAWTGETGGARSSQESRTLKTWALKWELKEELAGVDVGQAAEKGVIEEWH